MQKFPANSFRSLALSPALLQVVEELGYEKLTPIQAQSIPPLLAGKDVIGQSKTGSGKTASFALPVLQNLNVHGRRLQALVLCPTRELCTQVAREIRKLGRRHPGLQVLILSGGTPIFPQLTALENGVHIAVGTPGRVLDHIQRKKLNLMDVATVVLDEADRMLDMGFEEDMKTILAKTPPKRQTVFFSATFPRQIEAMSRAYQQSPVRVTIEESQTQTPEIRQVLYETQADQKLKALIWLLQQNQPESAIIFCNQKATVAELARTLTQAGVSAAGIHGDLEQYERDRVMAKFRNLSTRILVATDVAARGIDIEDLDLVCNFDLPSDPDVYIHRIGRTGRAGKKGLAISLAHPREKTKIHNIEKATGKRIEVKTLASTEQLAVEAQKSVLKSDAKMDTLYIAAGRKDKMRPGDILGALTGEAGGLKGTDIGKIEIHDNFSYVAVAKNIAATAVQRLTIGKIKGRRIRVHLVK